MYSRPVPTSHVPEGWSPFLWLDGASPLVEMTPAALVPFTVLRVAQRKVAEPRASSALASWSE